MNDVIGNPHTDDNLVGTAANDKMQGLSGNDVIFGGKGDDLIIGGSGSDVMTGGLGADTFQWSAGHITNGATDYITDFDIRQNDALSFLSSGGGQNVEIVGVTKGYLNVTTANGVDLQNNVATGTDITFTIKNSVTGATQEIVLLDAWSGSLSAKWDAYLATLGTHF
jgi:Ca2+-binding RTX toxin-like protein